MSSTEPLVAQSNLSPASNTQGTPVQARLFKITDIPAAMDAIDWPVSAALMRQWFQGQPWPTENGGMSQRVKEHAEWPPAQYIQEGIVKMSWVASFVQGPAGSRRASQKLEQRRRHGGDS